MFHQNSERIVFAQNADGVDYTITIGIGGAGMAGAMSVYDAFKSAVAKVERKDVESGAAETLQAVNIFVSKPVPVAGQPFGRSPGETNALTLIQEMLDAAARTPESNPLYCDTERCANCAATAPTDAAGQPNGPIVHGQNCLVYRARTMLDTPKFKHTPPVDVEAEFVEFSSRVIAAIGSNHAAWAKERAAAIQEQLKSFTACQSTSKTADAVGEANASDIASAFQEFAYRAVSQMPFDDAAWARGRTDALFAHIRELGADQELDALDDFLTQFTEKVGAYVEACLQRAAADAPVEGALNPRKLYNELRDHVRTAASGIPATQRQIEKRFQQWWNTPSEITGHPPSATLDPYSARTAWYGLALGLTAPPDDAS